MDVGFPSGFSLSHLGFFICVEWQCWSVMWCFTEEFQLKRLSVYCLSKNVITLICDDFNDCYSRKKMSGGTEVLKSDYMLKRAQMKGKFKTENYKNRWFQLTSTVLRYCDGSIEVHPD